jgi:hypothetical protein
MTLGNLAVSGSAIKIQSRHFIKRHTNKQQTLSAKENTNIVFPPFWRVKEKRKLHITID